MRKSCGPRWFLPPGVVQVHPNLTKSGHPRQFNEYRKDQKTSSNSNAKPQAKPRDSRLRFGALIATLRIASVLSIGIHDAAEDFPLPVRLVNRPTINRPLVFLDYFGSAVVVNVALTFLLGRLQMAVSRPGVASPAVDVIVVDNRDD